MNPEFIAFSELASAQGIALPDLFAQLLKNGRTAYGPDWKTHWRERCLYDPPALISCRDFEWTNAQECGQIVHDWLNPGFQNGQRFLPFAQTGAGDIYCLMPIEQQGLGVARIEHASGEGEVVSPSFSHFVVTRFLEAFADLSHHREFSEQEIHQCIKADVYAVTQYTDEASRQYLRAFCDLPLVWHERPYSYRRGTETIQCLITPGQCEDALAKYPTKQYPPVPVVPSWEVPTYSGTINSPPPNPLEDID